MLSGSRRAGEEPLARVPTGVYSHDDGRSMLGRKLKGESVRELHDLGLLVDGGGDQTGRPLRLPGTDNDQRNLG